MRKKLGSKKMDDPKTKDEIWSEEVMGKMKVVRRSNNEARALSNWALSTKGHWRRIQLGG